MLDTLRKRLRSEKGFTLIELLVVMIILAILTAIAVPSYLSFRDRANNSAAGADVRAIIPSVESYFADNGTYTGMSVTGLQASYDQAIQTTVYSLSGLSGTSYCISATVNGKTYRKVGPAGNIGAGAVC
jgi:type IV pilus assembly protein PilA